MSRFTSCLLGGALLLTTPALAQRHLYLDLRGQLESGYAEGWLLGTRPSPLQVRPGRLAFGPAAALRLRTAGRWSASLDYAYTMLVTRYRLSPTSQTTTAQGGRATFGLGIGMDRLTTLAHYRLGRATDDAAARGLRVGWELLAGAGLNRVPSDQEYNQFSATVATPNDTVFLHTGRFRRSWAPQLTLGFTARLYHQQRERAFLTAYLVQGLADLVTYQAQSMSSGHIAPHQLRSRGSAMGFTLGLPLRLYSWPARS